MRTAFSANFRSYSPNSGIISTYVSCWGMTSRNRNLKQQSSVDTVMKNKNRRRRVFADLKIQGGLCLRITIYWVVCQLTMVVTIMGFASLEAPSSGHVNRYLVPALVVSSLVLPLVLLDLLIFSNRFAGPLFSFRRSLQRLSEGQAIDPIQFRSGDHLPDLSENLNRVSHRLMELENGAETQGTKSVPAGV